MNNLHRELAPISDGAWSQIEEETSRTLKRYLAGRRVVDVQGPGGVALSAVHRPLAQYRGVRRRHLARRRDVNALVELRVPFDLNRQQIDDVERGANDSDGSPQKTPRDCWLLLKIGPSSTDTLPQASGASAKEPAIP